MGAPHGPSTGTRAGNASYAARRTHARRHGRGIRVVREDRATHASSRLGPRRSTERTDMTPSLPLSLDSVGSARQRVARAEEIKNTWRTGQAPDAASALRDNPELAADAAIALDLAYEEFCTREEAGEKLDSVMFCAQFSFGVSLR